MELIKRLSGCAVLLALALVLAQSAAGSEQYAASDDVIIPQYLIELSYETSGNSTVGVACETIVFRNTGTANRSEDVCIAVPENAQVMQVMKMGHMTDAASSEVAYERDRDILCWNMTLNAGGMAMYSVRYVVPIGGMGTSDAPDEFVKKLSGPAIANYPINSLLLKANINTGGDADAGNTNIRFADGAGNMIEPDSANPEDDGGVHYTWEGPVAFEELHVIVPQPSQSQPLNRWITYAVIAMLLIAALTYPIIHVKNNKLRGSDGGLACSGCTACDKGKDDAEKEPGEGGDWEEMDEIITELTQSKEELIRKKKALLAVLSKLDEDHDSGEVSDEDYQRLTRNYKDKAIEIIKQLDKID
ncbi:MAG: hypothetical protein EF813_09415 [Methanosarcinales archaeon]|nr:MAG: hypothetical protein EF813_09415 [Methanosarcinales archaeon]